MRYTPILARHDKEHVRAEPEAYARLVTPGSYLVACDGIMGELAGAPRTTPDWEWDNPRAAAAEFAAARDDFVLETLAFLFSEGVVTEPVTYWPGAWLKRVPEGAAG